MAYFLIALSCKIQNITEWATHNKMVLDAMAEGTKALKKLNEDMPLEYVEQLLQDTEDALEVIYDSTTPNQSKLLYLDHFSLFLLTHEYRNIRLRGK